MLAVSEDPLGHLALADVVHRAKGALAQLLAPDHTRVQPASQDCAAVLGSLTCCCQPLINRSVQLGSCLGHEVSGRNGGCLLLLLLLLLGRLQGVHVGHM